MTGRSRREFEKLVRQLREMSFQRGQGQQSDEDVQLCEDALLKYIDGFTKPDTPK